MLFFVLFSEKNRENLRRTEIFREKPRMLENTVSIHIPLKIKGPTFASRSCEEMERNHWYQYIINRITNN